MANPKEHSLTALKPRRMLYIFVDGASRGNPGKSGIGVFCKTAANKVVIKEGFFTGAQTNNQAEYTALLYALFFLSQRLTPEQQGRYDIYVSSDSQLVVRQLNGEYKIKDASLAQLASLVKKLSKHMFCSYNHIPRELNQRADALANLGIDEKKYLPADFLAFLKENSITLNVESLCQATKNTL